MLVVTVAAVSTLGGSGLAGVDGLEDGVVDNVVGGGGRGLGDKSGGLLNALVVSPVTVGSSRRRRSSSGRGSRDRGDRG